MAIERIRREKSAVRQCRRSKNMKSMASKLSQAFEIIYLVIALGLVAVIAGSSYKAWSLYAIQNEQMAISEAVRMNSVALLSALKDAETGQRGFLLTGEERYLEPYREATRQVPEFLKRLTQAITTRPDQQVRLKRLKPLVAGKLAELQTTIELRRNQNPDAAVAIMRSDPGKAIMDEIREVCEAMETVAAGRWRSQAEEVHASSRRLGLISTVGSVTIFGLLVLASVTIHRGLRRRQLLIASLSASEGECREARDWLHTTIRSIGDGVIATDDQGKITFLNGVAQELTGWSQEEAVGVALEEVFVITNEETGATVENPATRALREGQVVGLAKHTRLTSKGGREVPIEDSAAPIRDEHGVVSGVVLVFRDATDRKQAEQAMAESVKQFRTMADHAPVLVWIAGPDGRAVWFNRPWLDFAGRSLEQELAHNPADSEHPEDHPQCLATYHEAFEARKPFTMQYRLRRGDGAYRWLLGNGSPLYDSNQVFTGFIGSCTDITEQKAVEEKLSRANDDLSQFAFAASHDLQEPLRMITSYSQLLVKGYRGELSDEAQMCVTFITEGTKRMRELLGDLLAYTGVSEPGEHSGELVDVNAIFASTVANLRTAIEESHAVVTRDPLPTVTGNPAHLAQVFQNLIGNAIKYRGPDAPRVHVSAKRLPPEWQFNVTDNGLGIEQEYHGSIFGVFKRLHGKEIPGTGIGLAICQRVLERHQGRIWVDSELGKGSQFFFTLPVGREEAVNGNVSDHAGRG